MGAAAATAAETAVARLDALSPGGSQPLSSTSYAPSCAQLAVRFMTTAGTARRFTEISTEGCSIMEFRKVHETDIVLGRSAPVHGLRWRRAFPGEEHQLGVLRQWLASLLPDCPARDDIASVATELGANAVRHTASGRGGWFGVEITWHVSMVRVAVADCGGPAEPRVIDDPMGESGRGLMLVLGFASRTGVCGDHRGRLIWADIPWGDAGTGGKNVPNWRADIMSVSTMNHLEVTAWHADVTSSRRQDFGVL